MIRWVLATLLAVTACSSSSAPAPEASNPNPVLGQNCAPHKDQWNELINNKKYEDAKVLCAKWLGDADVKKQAEAHICLSNVLINERFAGGITVITDKSGKSTYPPEVVQTFLQARAELEAALKLCPDDISIHLGRQYATLQAADYASLPKQLEDTLTTFKEHLDGAEIEHWLNYTYMLARNDQFEPALEYLRVLEKHYPKEERVVSNLGTMLAHLNRFDAATVYLQKAEKMDPKDTITMWNLGRVYDFQDKNDLARKYYEQAFAQEDDEERKAANACMYAEFLQVKLKDAGKACELQRQYCKERSACDS